MKTKPQRGDEHLAKMAGDRYQAMRLQRANGVPVQFIARENPFTCNGNAMDWYKIDYQLGERTVTYFGCCGCWRNCQTTNENQFAGIQLTLM